jgi:hypothetical protein
MRLVGDATGAATSAQKQVTTRRTNFETIMVPSSLERQNGIRTSKPH